MQPSLSLLRAFEAAARTGSFYEAATELHISPSAVSHAIRKLEQNLGTALFERDGRRIRLSTAGSALIRHVGPAFDDLRRGMDLVSTRGPKVPAGSFGSKLCRTVADAASPRLSGNPSRY